MRKITASELAERLQEVEMSGAAFSRYIGVHENTVANWLHGRQEVPGPVVRCLMLMRLAHRHRKQAFTE